MQRDQKYSVFRFFLPTPFAWIRVIRGPRIFVVRLAENLKLSSQQPTTEKPTRPIFKNPIHQTMINTTGVQSTAPQGLPESSSQPAIADEQDEAMFEALMGAQNSTTSIEELKSQLETAEHNLNAAKQTGDPIQIINASLEYRQTLHNYETATSLLNGDPA